MFSPPAVLVLDFEMAPAKVCCSSSGENQFYAVAEYAITNLLFVLILLCITDIDFSLILTQTVTNRA